MTAVFLVIGLMLAVGLLTLIPKTKQPALKAAIGVTAIATILVFFALGSFRYVPEQQLGVIVKNVGARSLPPGKIIATDGEKGPQAEILPPGWHPWLWPIIYDVEYHQVLEIPSGFVGMLAASDGQAMPIGEIYAPEWDAANFKRMAEDAVFFLTDGGGFKGPQASVLTPGKYRLNPKLFSVETVPVTNIERATVGVVKSNIGQAGPDVTNDGGAIAVVDRGQRGIWHQPLLPQEYYLNTKAYEVTKISTAKHVVQYTQASTASNEGEITVRSSDGFTFPVDVRIEFEIRPIDAAIVVSSFGDDQNQLRQRLTSAVRAIFRNNAEHVKAINYVQQRSLQESQSLDMLAQEMKIVGVTVTAVRIGDVGNEETLGELLKTQTDREIALQEQITFQEQERAAEQRKQLTRTEQEAEEEKLLATARYSVQIAAEEKQRQIIAAEAEGESIRIHAEAQAKAFAAIALEIGRGNAALIEILKIIGEEGIVIAPRVMVTGGDGTGSNPETTALIGTMLDSMLDK